MRIPIILLCLTTWLLSHSSLLAQRAEPFRQQFEWKQRSTENFTLYYPDGSENTAGVVLRLAERARYEIGVLLDYRPDGPHTLVYLPHTQAWLYSPFGMEEPITLPGRINLPEHFGLVIHPGKAADLYHEVRRQVARVLLRELNYGYQLGSATQTALLYYDADWFSEGLSDYIGYGWTHKDEQVIKSLTSYQLLELAQEGQGYLNRIARRSIWHFITHEYGDAKLREIIYLADISHSIEAGIISVLGITLSSLTNRWQQYIQKRYREQQSGRMMLADLNEAIPLPQRKGEIISSFAHDPHGKRAAIFFNQSGELRLYIYDEDARQYTATALKAGLERPDGQGLKIEPQLAWSHDGKTIATTLFNQDGYQLAFYQVEEDEVSYHPLPTEVEAINHIGWAYQDDRLVYSVRHGGQTDLWIAPKNSTRFTPLTNDVYDDHDPTWSTDDQFIFFASNRETTDLESRGKRWSSLRRNLDLFKLSIKKEGRTLTRLTETPSINEYSPQPASSFEVLYLSDASGIPNLRKLNIFQLAEEPVSNLTIGIAAYQVYENRLLVRQPRGGEVELYLMPLAAISSSKEPQPTLLRIAYEVAFEQERKKQQAEEEEEEEAMEEPTEVDSSQVVAAEPDSTESEVPGTDQEQETAEEEKETSEPVRYYIFDEETEPYEVRNATDSPPAQEKPSARSNVTPSRLTTSVFGRTEAPKYTEIEVSREKQAQNVWQSDYFSINLTYDPFARLGTHLGTSFSDLFQRHRLTFNYTPFFHLQSFLRNHLFNAEYVYQPGRIDWFGRVGFMTRQARELSNLTPSNFQQDSAIFRFNQVNFQAGGRYAINSFLVAEASLGYFGINRIDQKLQREQRFEASDNLLRAGAAFRYNRVEQSQGYSLRGLAISGRFDSYYSLTNNNFAFHRTMAQVRYYRPIYDKIVLAIRAEGAFNFPRAVEQYYLGGVDSRVMMLASGQSEENLVDPQLDTALYRTHFLGFATPIRGFRNAVRAGSRYLVSNIELRIPVSRLLKNSLSSNRLYNLELIPFLDVGATWVEGNPFSQKKPTDTQYIPMGAQGPFSIKLQTLKSPFLIGFGSGLRLNLLGWSMRADLAWGVDDYAVQRPSLTLSMGHNF